MTLGNYWFWLLIKMVMKSIQKETKSIKLNSIAIVNKVESDNSNSVKFCTLKSGILSRDNLNWKLIITKYTAICTQVYACL